MCVCVCVCACACVCLPLPLPLPLSFDVYGAAEFGRKSAEGHRPPHSSPSPLHPPSAAPTTAVYKADSNRTCCQWESEDTRRCYRTAHAQEPFKAMLRRHRSCIPGPPPHLALYRLTYSDRIRQDNTRWGEACSCGEPCMPSTQWVGGTGAFSLLNFLTKLSN